LKRGQLSSSLNEQILQGKMLDPAPETFQQPAKAKIESLPTM
jgi:hypothetical protein